MKKKPTPPEEEVDIGLEYYYTDSEPLGGKLKAEPEHFIVEEISKKPEPSPDGEYTIARVKVRNWETNRLIKILADKIGISRKRIGFGGTKDKRAVTTQLMSFRCDPATLSSIILKDVNIDVMYMSNRQLTIGDLYGNNFHVTISGIEKNRKKTEEIARDVIEKLNDLGGFPNYFGIQRFGTVRPITHLIGKDIIKGDYRNAVMTYIGNPLEGEMELSFNARKKLENELDFQEALDYYPKFYSFERSMIHHLTRDPDDWIGALNTAPENLKMMFVHAYQSYIFNRILSERIRLDIPLNEPIVGDIILPLNKENLPDNHRYIEVKGSNIEEMTTLVRKGLGFISGMLMGTQENYSSGQMGEIERKIASMDGIGHEDFRIDEIEKISSKGIRRQLVSPVFDLKWKMAEDHIKTRSMHLRFSLYRGSYATSFLREFIKGSIMNY